MREQVYSQEPGASTLQGRSGEQRRCRSSTTPSKGSLERKNRLFSKGNGGIIARRRDIMEILDTLFVQSSSFVNPQLPTEGNCGSPAVKDNSSIGRRSSG